MILLYYRGKPPRPSFEHVDASPHPRARGDIVWLPSVAAAVDCLRPSVGRLLWVKSTVHILLRPHANAGTDAPAVGSLLRSFPENTWRAPRMQQQGGRFARRCNCGLAEPSTLASWDDCSRNIESGAVDRLCSTSLVTNNLSVSPLPRPRSREITSPKMSRVAIC